MADIRIGDRMKAHIHYGMEGGSTLPAEEGTVVYVHPEGRFYTLEFRFPKGRFRESYWLAPPPEMLADRPDHFARLGGRHHKQNGALGAWLETM